MKDPDLSFLSSEPSDTFDNEDENHNDDLPQLLAASKGKDLISLPPEISTAEIQVEVADKASLEEVTKSDLQITNVQLLMLLSGMSQARTIQGLCTVSEQLSKTMRYRRDVMGLQKEKPASQSSGKWEIIPVD